MVVGGLLPTAAGFREHKSVPPAEEGDEQKLPDPALSYCSHPVGGEGGVPGPSHLVDMEQPPIAIYPAHPEDPLSREDEGVAAIPLGLPCMRPSPLQYPATPPAVCVDVGMQTSQVSQPLPNHTSPTS